MALLDNDELTGIDNDADDWQFVSLGEQQNFGIKTAGLPLYLFTIRTSVCLQIFCLHFHRFGRQSHSMSNVSMLCQRIEGTFRGIH